MRQPSLCRNGIGSQAMGSFNKQWAVLNEAGIAVKMNRKTEG